MTEFLKRIGIEVTVEDDSSSSSDEEGESGEHTIRYSPSGITYYELDDIHEQHQSLDGGYPHAQDDDSVLRFYDDNDPLSLPTTTTKANVDKNVTPICNDEKHPMRHPAVRPKSPLVAHSAAAINLQSSDESQRMPSSSTQVQHSPSSTVSCKNRMISSPFHRRRRGSINHSSPSSGSKLRSPFGKRRSKSTSEDTLSLMDDDECL
jgi:hypothetical protein